MPVKPVSAPRPARWRTAAAVVSALRAATNKMDEDEVPMEGRTLFITPTLLGMIQDLDTTKSKEVLARFASVVQVPQTRFYTAIEQRDGSTSGEEAGGYKKVHDPLQSVPVYRHGRSACGSRRDRKPLRDRNQTGSGRTRYAGLYPAVGDYVVTVAGKDINFMVIHKDATIQFPSTLRPGRYARAQPRCGCVGSSAIAWSALQRCTKNKTAGIYLHAKA